MSELIKIDYETETISMRSLYAFLRMNKNNFTTWCKKNIVNNMEVVKDRDYTLSEIKGGTTCCGDELVLVDYVITKDLAIKLLNKCKSDKALAALTYIEWYFTSKGINKNNKINELDSQIQVDELKAQVKEVTSMFSEISNKLSNLKVEGNTPSQRVKPTWRKSYWNTRTIEKINAYMEYKNSISKNNYSFTKILFLLLVDVEKRHDVDMNDYINLYLSQYDVDIDNPCTYILNAIEAYKESRYYFTETLNSMLTSLNIGID